MCLLGLYKERGQNMLKILMCEKVQGSVQKDARLKMADMTVMIKRQKRDDEKLLYGLMV